MSKRPVGVAAAWASEPWWLAWLIPASLGAALVGMAVGRQISGMVVGIFIAIVCVLGIAAVLGLREGTLPRSALLVLLPPTVAVGALGVSSVFAANPAVAYAGLWGARTGWVMWFAALALMWAAFVLAYRAPDSTTHVDRLTAAVAVIGGVSTLSVFAVASGMLAPPVPGWSEKPAGVFENAQSLAQVLVLASLCAAAWFVTARSPKERVAAGAVVALNVSGLFFSEARGALLGLAFAAIVFVALRAGAPLARNLARGVLAFGAAAYGALLVIAGIAIEHPLIVQLDTVVTGRLTLWHSMLTTFAGEYVLGAGPMNVSAYTTWGVDGDLVPMGQVAFDPHSLPVYWLVSGGVVGALVAAWAAWSLGGDLFRAGRRGLAAALTVAGIAGWLGATLSTWANPFALMLVAALTATVVANERVRHAGTATTARPSMPTRDEAVPASAFAISLALACAIVGVTFAPHAAAELRWTAALTTPSLERMRLAETLADSTGDPSYVVRAIVSYFEASELDDDGELLDRALRISQEHRSDAEWHVSFAYNDIYLQARAYAGGAASLEDVRSAVVRARRADPATGFFDFIAAERFLVLGHDDLAPLYAERSLGYPQTPETRAILEDVMAGIVPGSE